MPPKRLPVVTSPPPARNAPPASHSGHSAYEQLYAWLVRGVLEPGRRVTEADLATQLGMSRTPVREAMRRLQHEQLLVVDGGGARPRVAVAALDPREAIQVYEATGALEGLAAREIALLALEARKSLSSSLAALDDEFRVASARRAPDADALFERHSAFHRALRAAGSATVVASLLDALAPRLARYQWYHAPLLQEAQVGFASMHKEHAAIIKAVRSGNADALEQAVRDNWQQAARRLATAIDLANARIERTGHRRTVRRKRD